MELNKNKYSQKEVVDILNAYKSEYEKRIVEQREIIKKLNEEIKELYAREESVNDKERLVLSALLRAEKISLDLQEKSKQDYALELERLKKFSTRWDNYFKELKAKYPMYPPVNQALEFKNAIDLGDNLSAKEIINKIDNELPEKKEKFDPKSKIKDYISATSDNGFNLDDVLNPGELQLEDICKELGLIDGNE